jgi:hypothetical protein
MRTKLLPCATAGSACKAQGRRQQLLLMLVVVRLAALLGG